LPDDRRTDRLQAFARPEERSFSLVSYCDRADLLDADLRCGFAGGRELAAPDVTRRLLNPAWLGKLRSEVVLCAGDGAAALVPNERAAGGCSLIEGEDESRCYASSSSSRRRPMTTLATAAKTASNAPTPSIRFILRSVLLAAAH